MEGWIESSQGLREEAGRVGAIRERKGRGWIMQRGRLTGNKAFQRRARDEGDVTREPVSIYRASHAGGAARRVMFSYRYSLAFGRLAGRLSSAAMSIEVEVKFAMADDTRERLVARGARQMGASRFTDIYYDTPAHSLTRQARVMILPAMIPCRGVA